MRYRFGEFEVDDAQFAVRRRGTPIRVQRLVFDALRYLIEHRDRVVSRQELRELTWGGTVVSDGAVHQAISQLRRVLGDDGSSQSVIRTVRGRGFRFVAGVTVCGAKPPAGELARIAMLSGGLTVPLGRAAELATIELAANRAAGGSGTLVVVSGEPGIGKTTLLEATAQRLSAREMRCLVGRCREDMAEIALRPWRAIARGLFGTSRMHGADSPLHGDHAELAQLFPELELRTRAWPGRTPEDRARAFSAFVDAIGVAASRWPLLLVLEDLHAADAASLRLLEHLLARLQTFPLLLLASYRDTEPTSNTLASLLRAHSATGHEIRLGGLPRDASRELLSRRLMRTPTDAMLDSAMRLTAGSPFLLHQLARELEGADETPQDLEAAFRLPNQGETVARRSLNALPQTTIELLEAACVFGREFELAALAAVSDFGLEAATNRLAPALDSGFVHASGRGRYRFAHALVQQALYTGLAAAARMSLHSRVAEHVRAHVERDPSLLALAAHHHSKGEVSKEAVAWLVRAARQAQAELAFEQAAAFFGHAHEAIQRCGEPSSQNDVLYERAVALRYAGRSNEATSAFLELAAASRAAGDAAGFARAAIGYGQTQQGFFDVQLIELLREAIDDMAPHPPQRQAALLAELAFALRQTPEQAQAAACGRAAVELARSVNDAALLSRALFAYRWNMPGSECGPALLSVSSEAVQRAEQANDTALAAVGRTWKISDLLDAGDRDAFEREVELHRRIAQELGRPWHRLIAMRYDVVRALLDGELDAAETLAGETLRTGQELGEQVSEIIHCVQVYLPRRERGRLDELEGFARQLLAIAPWASVWRSFLGLVLTETGRLEEARALLAELRFEDAAVADSVNYMVGVAIAAEVAAACRDEPSATRLRRLLAPHAGRHIVVGGGSLYYAPVERYLGLLDLACERFEAAKQNLEAALEAAGAVRARHWIARLSVELAEALAHGEARDQDRALELLDRTRCDIRRMRLTQLSARAESLRRALAGGCGLSNS